MSWSSIKTEGIVLTVAPVREADRAYNIFTPTHGKLEILGRGAQKGLAKLASHLEPFAIVDVEVIRGRHSTTVISVDRRFTFTKISGELSTRLLAQSSLILLDRYTQELADDQISYQDLVDWLSFLNVGRDFSATRSTFLLGSFLLKLMKRSGYDVELLNCLACRNEIEPSDFRWHTEKGGLVCSVCVEAHKEEWFLAQNIEDNVIKLLRFARDSRYDDLIRLALSGVHMECFANMVHNLVSFHLPGRYDRPFWQGILADTQLEIRNESV